MDDFNQLRDESDAKIRKETWLKARDVLLGEVARLRKETAKKGPDPKRLAIINRLVSLAKHFKERE